jgi:hypothetical protein
MPCQSGKSEEQIKLAYVEAFRYGNVPFYFTRNSGGIEDGRAMAASFNAFNTKVQGLLKKYLHDVKKFTKDEIAMIDHLNLDVIGLDVYAPGTSQLAHTKREVAIRSKRPCVIIMLGNAASAEKLCLHMRLFNKERAVQIGGVPQIKAVAFFDEAEAHCGTDSVSGAMEKVMKKNFEISKKQGDGGAVFLMGVSAHAAFIRRYHTSATVFAIVAQASAIALQRHAKVAATNLVVLEPDISDSYNGFVDTVPAGHPVNRTITRVPVPAAEIKKPKRRGTKRRQDHYDDDDSDDSDDDGQSIVYDRDSIGIQIMLDDMMQDASQTRSALISTDTTRHQANQHAIAKGVQSYLKHKSIAAMILVWNCQGLFVYSSAADDLTDAFNVAAEAYGIKSFDPKDCPGYTGPTVGTYKGTVRDGLSAVHHLYTKQICLTSDCEAFATHGEAHSLPRYCDKHKDLNAAPVHTGAVTAIVTKLTYEN